MTRENILKLHKHFTRLAEGEFNERTFDFELESKDPQGHGSIFTGKMTSTRIALIKSDALAHKTQLEANNPWVIDVKEGGEDSKEVKEVPKSKNKKK